MFVFKVAIEQKEPFARLLMVLDRLPQALTFVLVILLQCDAPIRVRKSRTMAVQQEIKHRGNRARRASVPYSLYI
jgi:hypothetical protein